MSVIVKPSILLPGLAAIGLMGCDSQTEDPSSDRQSGASEAVQVDGQELARAPVIGRPGSPVLVRGGDNGEMVWLRDTSGDPGLHLIDASSGEVIRSFGRAGEGPGEFSRGRPSDLLPDPERPNAVWAWDMGLQRLTRFDPKPSNGYDVDTRHLQQEIPIQRVLRLDDGRLLGVRGAATARFVLFDRDGVPERSVDQSLPGPEDAPTRERIDAANQAVALCAWPGRGFAMAHTQYGKIEFYDYDARAVALARVPHPSDPIFEPNNDGVPVFRWRRSHYVGCAATTDYMYAIYSGRELDVDDDPAISASGNVVHVFDWAGTLHEVYQLDRYVKDVNIVSDPEGYWMYAASLPDAALYRYALPYPP